MWTPRINKWSDAEEVFEFMKTNAFAVLVSESGHQPVATHLPVLVEKKDDTFVITTHIAKANPHWQLLDKGRVLVIFSAPHAYISPSLYEHSRNVPTWNYIAVHAFGHAELHTDHPMLLSILESTIVNYEENYLAQWKVLDQDYVKAMLDEIVGITIHVDEWTAKEKLSQNKSQGERSRIADHLLDSEKNHEQEIGRRMKEKDD